MRQNIVKKILQSLFTLMTIQISNNLASSAIAETKFEAGVGGLYGCEDCKKTASQAKQLQMASLEISKVPIKEWGTRLDPDPRRPVDRTPGIGFYYTNFGEFESRATGQMINECLMITAKHPFKKIRTREDLDNETPKIRDVIGKETSFYFGGPVKNEAIAKYMSKGKVVAAVNNGGELPDNMDSDIAIVKLNKIKMPDGTMKYPGEIIGFLTPAKFTVQEVKDECLDLKVVGFPGEKDVRTLWGQNKCEIFFERSGYGSYDIGCPITDGNSGGPLICTKKEPDPKFPGDNSKYILKESVIGVASDMDTYLPNDRSYFTSFQAYRSFIVSALKNYTCD